MCWYLFLAKPWQSLVIWASVTCFHCPQSLGCYYIPMRIKMSPVWTWDTPFLYLTCAPLNALTSIYKTHDYVLSLTSQTMRVEQHGTTVRGLSWDWFKLSHNLNMLDRIQLYKKAWHGHTKLRKRELLSLTSSIFMFNLEHQAL